MHKARFEPYTSLLTTSNMSIKLMDFSYTKFYPYRYSRNLSHAQLECMSIMLEMKSTTIDLNQQ